MREIDFRKRIAEDPPTLATLAQQSQDPWWQMLLQRYPYCATRDARDATVLYYAETRGPGALKDRAAKILREADSEVPF